MKEHHLKKATASGELYGEPIEGEPLLIDAKCINFSANPKDLETVGQFLLGVAFRMRNDKKFLREEGSHIHMNQYISPDNKWVDVTVCQYKGNPYQL